jgi:DNA-binding beta-propeller fold protein YncE
MAVSPDGARLYVVSEVAREFAKANLKPARDQVVGLITVVDVGAAETNPTRAIVGRAFVGRAPVRVAVTPDGATLWVTARGSNALLAFDAANLLSTSCNPLLATTAVGLAPVGLALVNGGAGVVVANSNRFATGPRQNQTVTLVDARPLAAGNAVAAGNALALLGQIRVGAFPREIAADAQAFFVSNYKSNSISGVALDLLPSK